MRCFRIPVILSFYLSSFHFFWLLVPKLRKSNREHREFAKHSVRWNGWILLLNKSVSYRFLLQSKLYYQFSSLQCFEFYPTNHLFNYITLFSKKKGIRRLSFPPYASLQYIFIIFPLAFLLFPPSII